MAAGKTGEGCVQPSKRRYDAWVSGVAPEFHPSFPDKFTFKLVLVCSVTQRLGGLAAFWVPRTPVNYGPAHTLIKKGPSDEETDTDYSEEVASVDDGDFPIRPQQGTSLMKNTMMMRRGLRCMILILQRRPLGCKNLNNSCMWGRSMFMEETSC